MAEYWFLRKILVVTVSHKQTLRKLLISGRITELLDSMANLGGQVIQIMTSDGELFARSNIAGKCCIHEEDIHRLEGERTIPTLCVQKKCPYFAGQYFSTVNVYSDNVGLVVGCYPQKNDANRAYIEFVSHVLSEIVTREEEIIAVSSDILVKYEELSILYEVSRSIASSFSEKEVATLLIGMAAQGLGLSEGAVFLADDKSGKFREIVSLNGPDGEKADLSDNAEAFLRPLIKSTSPVIDTTQAGTVLLGLEDSTETLLVPLVHHSHIDGTVQLLGAMALSGKREGSFSSEDSHFMSTLTTQGALGIINCRSVSRLRENERLSRDLELGQSIQQSFFPEKAPEGEHFRLSGLCIPASRVGGDYFDYFLNSKGHVVMVIADVSGHHLGSAILMASIRSVLRTALKSGASPVEVLRIANETMYDDMSRAGSFVSVFIASYDPDSGMVTCANAGHNPPLLILPIPLDNPDCIKCGHTGTSECCPQHADRICTYSIPVDVDGLLIGVLPDYPFEEFKVQIPEGGLLYLYTDGAIEASNDDQEQYGMERLSRLLCINREKSVSEICELVKNEVEDFSSGSDRQDDLTMVALKIV